LIWFTSDLHLGHDNIINLTSRPFSDVEEMDNALISNWNNCVSRTDEVYIVGDLSLKPVDVVESYLRRMNGKKSLVRGNHDRVGAYPYKAITGLEWIRDYHEMKAVK